MAELEKIYVARNINYTGSWTDDTDIYVKDGTISTTESEGATKSKGYATLQSAIGSVAENATMAVDIVESTVSTAISGSTYNVSGQTLQGASGSEITVNTGRIHNGGSDTKIKGGYTLIIQCTNTSNGQFNNDGTLTVSDGVTVQFNLPGSGTGNPFTNKKIFKTEGSTVVIVGGTFRNQGSNYATINGTTFNAQALSNAVQFNANHSTISIGATTDTGGVIGDAGTVYQQASVIDFKDSTVTIATKLDNRAKVNFTQSTVTIGPENRTGVAINNHNSSNCKIQALNSTVTVNGNMTNEGIFEVSTMAMLLLTGVSTAINGKTIKVKEKLEDTNTVYSSTLGSGAVTTGNTTAVVESSSFAAGKDYYYSINGEAYSEENKVRASKDLSIVTVSGDVTNSGTFTVKHEGSQFTAAGTITNSGIMTAESEATIEVASFTNGGTLEIKNDATMIVTDTSVGSFVNNGTIKVTNTALSYDGTITGSGSFEVSSLSTLNITSNAATAITLQNNATLADSSITTVSGTMSLASGKASFGGTNTLAGTTLTNAGTLTLTNATLTVTGAAIKNSGTITVDAASKISAVNIENTGTVNIVYNNANLDTITGTISGGDIYLDVTNCNFSGSEKILNTFTVTDGANVHLKVDGVTGDFSDSSILSAKVDSDGHIKLTKGEDRNVLFVNASWTAANVKNKQATYAINDGPTPENYNLYFGVNAFKNIQDAINAAVDGDTIVFYKPSGSDQPSASSLDFLSQGAITIDRDLSFETNTKTEVLSVKMDALRIAEGVTAKFKQGFYGLEDYLDNDGELDVVDDARFNADLVDNTGATILVGIASRLVADSIESGEILLRTGFIDSNTIGKDDTKDKWIIRPIAARVNADMYFVYPDNIVIDDSQTVTVTPDQYGNISLTGIATNCTTTVRVLKMNSDDEVVNTTAYNVVGNETITLPDGFYTYNDGYTYKVKSKYFTKIETIPATETAPATKVFSLTVDKEEEFERTLSVTATRTKEGTSAETVVFNIDIAAKDPENPSLITTVALPDGFYIDDTYTYTTAVRLITVNGIDKIGVYAPIADDYSVNITKDENNNLIYQVIKPGDDEPEKGQTWNVSTDYEGLFLISDVFDLKKNTSGNYWSNTIYVDDSFKDKEKDEYGRFTFTTEGTGENAKTVQAVYADGKETADPSNAVYAFSSFLTAYNSAYAAKHGLGKDNQGVVIRVRGGTYAYLESTEKLSLVENDIIIEADKTDGENYDDVTMKLGGLNTSTTAHLLAFSHIKDLTIGGEADNYSDSTKNWEFGSRNGKTSVVSFLNIQNLTINGTLKSLGGATIRIINCENVVSNKHLSIAGGTLIIDSSNITLAGAHSDKTGSVWNGGLSTENNKQGAGNIIVRNSSFLVEGDQADGLYVNLKGGSEFTISGMSTVSGIFTNAAGSSDTQQGTGDNVGAGTRITFSNATLDEHTQILGQGSSNNNGAALHFNGYNSLTGSTVEQTGNKGMTVQSGATLNMSEGASISVGGNVQVSNAGTITVDNSSITAGSFDNTGNMTVTNGAYIDLGGGTFSNSGSLTVDLIINDDGTMSLGINGTIVNNGEVVIDLSNTDLPDNRHILLSDIPIESGNGEINVIGKGYRDGDQIVLADPQTKVLSVNTLWTGLKNGKNVGSYTYFGYNAYQDNSGPTGGKYLTFSSDTEKVIYYGGNSYTALELSTDAPDTLSITTAENPAKAEFSYSFTAESGAARMVSVEVKDNNNKIVAQRKFSVAESASGTTYSGIIGFGEFDGDPSHYSVTFTGDNIVNTSATAITAIENRATAEMDSLTVGETKTVSLSGATMSLTDSTTLVRNSGTLKVVGGESAKLTLNVTASAFDRDVTVEVSDSGNSEIQTIHVAAGQTTVDVKSGNFIKNREYEVKLTDNGQYEPVTEDNSLTVDVDPVAESLSRVFVQDALGAKYTFYGPALSTWNEITGTKPGTITVIPSFTNTNCTISISPEVNPGEDGSIVATINENGIITLNVSGDVAAQEVKVTATNAEAGCVFEKTFSIAKHEKSSAALAYTGSDYSTKFIDDYHYVSIDMNAGSPTAARDDITASDVTAKKITNLGTLTVASVADNNPASKLVFAVNRNEDASRSTTVGLTKGEITSTETLYVKENAATADLFLEGKDVGTQYDSITITDKYTFAVAGTTGEGGNISGKNLTLGGFTTVGTRSNFTITVKKGFGEIGTWTLSDDDIVNGAVTLSLTGSSTFAAGDYAVTVDETRTLTKSANAEDVTTKPFAKLTVTDTLANEGTLNVTDAEFVAKTLTNNSSTAQVAVSNSKIKVTSDVTNNLGKIIVEDASTFEAESVTNKFSYSSDSSRIEISGSTFKTESFTNGFNASLLVKDASTVNAGVVTNDDTISVSASTFEAESVTNNYSISITNSTVSVSSTDPSKGTISNNGYAAITMDKASLITAKSITNNGTITVDVTGTSANYADKVISLTGGAAMTGNGITSTANIYTNTNTATGAYEYWVSDASQATLYVNSAWDSYSFGKAIEGETGKFYGINAFKDFKSALELNVADEIVLVDGGKTLEVTGDIMLNVTKSVTVSGAGTVKFNVNPAGSSNDLCLSAIGAGTEITIGSGVVLDTTESAARGNVWLDYYTGGGTINLNGTIKGKNQIWLGGNVSIGTTGTLDAGGQICFRSGYNGADATVSVTGSANSDSSVQIKAKTNLEFTSGKVVTATTYIKGKMFAISDNHVNSDCALSVVSTNTTWDVSGALTSGTSGFADTFELKSGSTLKVGTTADVGGLVSMELTDSTMDVTKNMTNSGSIELKKDTAGSGLLARASLTNKGSISVDGSGSSVSVTGALTNGGVILVLDGLTAASANQTFTVEISDGGENAWTTTATLHRRSNTTDPVYSVVADFGTQVIPDGTYTVTVRKGADTVKTYNDYSVRNASVSLTNGSVFSATSLANSGSVKVTGDAAAYIGVPVPSGAKGGAKSTPEPEPGTPVINTGSITVENGASYNAGATYNLGSITVTNADFIAATMENTSIGTITVTNSRFDVGTIGSEGFTGGAVINSNSISITSETEKTSTVRFGNVTNNKTITIGSAAVNGSYVTAGGSSVSAYGTSVSAGTIDFSSDASSTMSMDWKSTLSFTGFTNAAGKLSINLEGFGTAGILKKKVLDYTGDSSGKPNDAYYKALLGETAWNAAAGQYIVDDDGDLWVQLTYDTVYVTKNASGTLSPLNPYTTTVSSAVAVKPKKIIVKDDGTTVGEAAYFSDVVSEIGDGSGSTVSFSKNVYAGKKYSAVTDYNGDSSLTIKNGSFQFLSGGGYVNANSTTYDVTGDIKLRIEGGSFVNYSVAGADKVNQGILNRTGNVTLEIAGGNFEKNIGGGVLLSGASVSAAHSTLTGTISVEITGGSFAEDTWIYGGCFSSTQNTTLNPQNVLDGSTLITVDLTNAKSTDKAITLGNIVAGSHGYSPVDGNAQLVFKGTVAEVGEGDDKRDNLVIAGRIWGGCAGDYYIVEGSGQNKTRTLSSFVTGNRILTFDGFDGELKCAKIGGFSDIEFNDSRVTLNEYDLSETSNWSFDINSTLSGHFVNNFKGDTLNLTNFSSGTTRTLITDTSYGVLENEELVTNSDVFSGFSELYAIRIGEDVIVCRSSDATAAYTADTKTDTETWSWSSGSLSLVTTVNDTTGNATRSMQLTLA